MYTVVTSREKLQKHWSTEPNIVEHFVEQFLYLEPFVIADRFAIVRQDYP